MAKFSNTWSPTASKNMSSKEVLSSSRLKHHLDKNSSSSALKKTGRFVLLYLTQTVHFKSKHSEFQSCRSLHVESYCVLCILKTVSCVCSRCFELVEACVRLILF